MLKTTFVLTNGLKVEIQYPRSDGSGIDPIQVVDDGTAYHVKSTDTTSIEIVSFPRVTVLLWFSDAAQVTYK